MASSLPYRNSLGMLRVPCLKLSVGIRNSHLLLLQDTLELLTALLHRLLVRIL